MHEHQHVDVVVHVAPDGFIGVESNEVRIEISAVGKAPDRSAGIGTDRSEVDDDVHDLTIGSQARLVVGEPMSPTRRIATEILVDHRGIIRHDHGQKTRYGDLALSKARNKVA